MAKSKPLPSQETLLTLLDYNPDTGELFWKTRPPEMFRPGNQTQQARSKTWNTRHAGTAAFTHAASGYLRGAIFGKSCLAHRVIWKMNYGSEPDEIDHINGRRCDNRLSNLAASNSSHNAKNAKIRVDNKTGAMGVGWFKRDKRWYATIQVNKKAKHLGYFDNLEDAISARRDAELKYGYGPTHGRL